MTPQERPFLGAFETWEQRLAFERQSGRMEAHHDAARVIALLVEAAGGSIFVPDRLVVVGDLYVEVKPFEHGRRYFTRHPVHTIEAQKDR